jgi:hypothetical protein
MSTFASWSSERTASWENEMGGDDFLTEQPRSPDIATVTENKTTAFFVIPSGGPFRAVVEGSRGLNEEKGDPSTTLGMTATSLRFRRKLSLAGISFNE